MATLQARYEADGADFLDGEPKRLLPDLYYLGDFHKVSVYGFSAASRFFLVNAPGGPGLLPFVKSGLQRLGVKPVDPAAVLLTSCDPTATAGLGELIANCHPQLVVSPAGLEHLKKTCPAGTAVLSAEELPARGWFKVVPRPLRGRGVAPIAYQVQWAGKTVLFSGRDPDQDQLADGFRAVRGHLKIESGHPGLPELGLSTRGTQARPLAARGRQERPERQFIRQRLAGCPRGELPDRVQQPDATTLTMQTEPGMNTRLRVAHAGLWFLRLAVVGGVVLLVYLIATNPDEQTGIRTEACPTRGKSPASWCSTTI